MSDHLHGFTKTDMSEMEFSKFLRKHGAIDTWTTTANANMWHNSSGKNVAVAFYTGEGGMTVTYWVSADLLKTNNRNRTKDGKM